MANKQERIATLIRKNIAEIIQFDLKNPHLGFVTIPEVKVSSDFSYAKVYVSFLGAKYPLQNLAELNRCKGYVRSSLAKKIDLRKVPELTFLLDDTFYKDERINAALKREEEQIEKAHKESK